MSKPIRIGLIGLSSSAVTSWAAEGHLPYLQSSRGRAKYEIVALLNSSVAAAEAAKQHFGLPATVTPYGSPADLAADPTVELVVCNTRVDVHAAVTRDVITAGKPVFIEWPLAESTAVGEALVGGYGDAASALRTVIGFQGRLAPPVLKMKALIASGAIGNVLSSDIRGYAHLTPRAAYPAGLAYFADRSYGGNPSTISFMHMLDYVHDTLGDWADGNRGFVSRMQLQRPQVDITDETGAVVRTVTSDVPDLVSLTGALQPGSADPLVYEKGVRVVDGATLSVSYRNGPAFPGTPNFLWTVNGEKGEIRMTSHAGSFLHSDSYAEPAVIEVHDHATDQITKHGWEWEDWQEELPTRARIVAQLYERYYNAVKLGWEQVDKLREQGSGRLPADVRWPTLLDALTRSKELDLLFERWDKDNEGRK